MTESHDSSDLRGRFLVAMPGMGDPRFARSVVFVCAHSPRRSMGLIVNKPAPQITFRDLLGQLGVPVAGKLRALPVHFGGPVEHERGFVLHSTDYSGTVSTRPVGAGFCLTATRDILHDIARGEGPRDCLLALGYAGWGPGQLDREIAQNGWLTCDARADIVFGADDAAKWARAIESMGISPSLLSSSGGRA
jgi:putative transcriptional regulator